MRRKRFLDSDVPPLAHPGTALPCHNKEDQETALQDERTR